VYGELRDGKVQTVLGGCGENGTRFCGHIADGGGARGENNYVQLRGEGGNKTAVCFHFVVQGESSGATSLQALSEFAMLYERQQLLSGP
jgi:hypothetical protein